MVRSLHELEWREEKGEERGSLDKGGVQAAVSPKEENRRGVRYEDEGEDQKPIGCREKGKHTVHEYGGCSIMPWLRENGVLVDPDTDDVCRARGNSDLACVVRVS